MGQALGITPWGEEDADFENGRRKISQIGQRGAACRHLTLLAPASMERMAFMKRIACDIRRGKIKKLTEKLVIVLDLSTFNCNEKLFPYQVLLGDLFPDERDLMIIKSFEWMIRHPSKIVFVIYMLHSIPFDLQRKRPLISYFKSATADVVLFNLLSGHLFPGARIISSHDNVKMKNLHKSIQPDHCITLEGLVKDSPIKLVRSFQKEVEEEESKGTKSYSETLSSYAEKGLQTYIAAKKKGENPFAMEPADLEMKRKVLTEHLIDRLNKETDEQRRVELYQTLLEGRDGSIHMIHTAVKDIDVSELTLCQQDSYAIGFIMKHSKYLKAVNLRRCNLSDSKMEMICKLADESNLRLEELEVAGNYFGLSGVSSVARLARHCKVKVLLMWSCGLESQHMQRLLGGTRGLALDTLDVSSNKIGIDGMLRLGKAVSQWKLKSLELRNCGFEGRHLQKLIDGMGVAKLNTLNLNEWHDTPQYMPQLLPLLHCVRKELSLQGWTINESDRAKLQEKLDKMGPNNCLRIRLSEGVELKAR